MMSFIIKCINNPLVNSCIGIVIGSVITYVFNKILEKKKMKDNILQLIYDKMFILINDSLKASQNILLMCEFSKLLEKQKNNPTNDADILEEIDKSIIKNLIQIPREINIMLELNFYMEYHQIPLNEFYEQYNNLTEYVGRIKDNCDDIRNIYKNMLNSVGYIKIENENWDKLLEKEKLIKYYIDECRKQMCIINIGIQKNYFQKMLKFKTK